MKKLIIGCAICLLAYCGYWFYGANKFHAILTEQGEGAERLALQTTYSAQNVKGFPLAFKSNLDGIVVTDRSNPSAMKRFQADEAQLRLKAYYPLSWQVRHAGASQVQWTSGRVVTDVSLETQAARLSGRSRLDGQPARLHLEAETIDVLPTPSVPIRQIAYINGDFSRKGDDAHLDFKGTQIALADISQLSQVKKVLGDEIQSLSFHVHIENYGTDAARFVSDDVELNWGEANARGQLDVRQSELGLKGQIRLNISSPTKLLKLARQEGVMSQGQAMMAGIMLSGLPKTDDGRVSLTFPVESGRINWLGYKFK